MNSICYYRHVFLCVIGLSLLTFTSLSAVSGFGIPATTHSMRTTLQHGLFSSVSGNDESIDDDPSDIVAKRIIVSGSSVQGGYYRACVLNEAGRFRKLTGTMSPPDETDTAEIYVEGKRKLVDGFVRWCRRGNKNVGLNQITQVKEVIDENPVGLYDDFYVKMQ